MQSGRPGIRTRGGAHDSNWPVGQFTVGHARVRQTTARQPTLRLPARLHQRGFNDVREQRLARGLGWFSLGIGVAQVLWPHRINRMIGVPDRGLLMRAIGLRQIASGVGILTQREPKPWLWSRVGGDFMDLTLLGNALRASETHHGRVAAATVAVFGMAILDILCSRQVSRHPRATPSSEEQDGAIRVERSFSVNCSPEEAYRFWRDFENLPRFMRHLRSVQKIDGQRSHWIAKAPAGRSVEWDAEVTDDRPNQLIAWRSLPGAGVENSGSVRFLPGLGGRGTVVRAKLQYKSPGGALTSIIAKLFGEEPSQQLREDLRRFKNILETGEIPTTEGQSSGWRSVIRRLVAKIRP